MWGLAIQAPLPQLRLTQNRKVHYQALRDYYRDKLRFLEERHLHRDDPKLIRMACWDAPVAILDLSRGFMRRLFRWQARRYYRRRLQEAEKRLRKIR